MCCVGIVQDQITLPASSGFFSSKSSTWGARNQCAATASVIFRGVKARRVVRNYGLSTSVSACSLLSWWEPKEEQNRITHLMITKSVQLCCTYQQCKGFRLLIFLLFLQHFLPAALKWHRLPSSLHKPHPSTMQLLLLTHFPFIILHPIEAPRFSLTAQTP